MAAYTDSDTNKNPASLVRDISTVDQDFDRLAKEVQTIQMNLQNLRDRLDPVLLFREEKGLNCGEAPQPMRCRVSQRIADIYSYAQDANEHLQSIIGALEI